MKRTAGFTFVEMLAAMAFLGILMPVVIAALLEANRAGSAAERMTLAVQLGENKLNELALGGAWSSASGSGDFGTDWPDYRWKLTTGDWQSNAMTELTVDVFFKTQGREHDVRLSTLVNQSVAQLQQQLQQQQATTTTTTQ